MADFPWALLQKVDQSGGAGVDQGGSGWISGVSWTYPCSTPAQNIEKTIDTLNKPVLSPTKHIASYASSALTLEAKLSITCKHGHIGHRFMDFLYSLQAFLFSLCRARSGTPGPLEAHRGVRQGCANK